MTTRLTVSSLAAPITIKVNTTFAAPLAANIGGPFVIAPGLTSKGALATVNLNSIGDVAAAKTTLILPGASTDYLFKTASGAVTISTSKTTTNPTTHKVTTTVTVIAALDLTKTLDISCIHTGFDADMPNIFGIHPCVINIRLSFP